MLSWVPAQHPLPPLPALLLLLLLLLRFIALQGEACSAFPPQVVVIKTILELCEILFGNALCFVPPRLTGAHRLFGVSLSKESASPEVGNFFFPYLNIEETKEEPDNESPPPNKGLSCDFLRGKVKSTGCVS